MSTMIFTLSLLEGESGVAINRMGKQALEIALPIPLQMQGQDLRVVTVDRNGQLEYLPATIEDHPPI